MRTSLEIFRALTAVFGVPFGVIFLAFGIWSYVWEAPAEESFMREAVETRGLVMDVEVFYDSSNDGAPQVSRRLATVEFEDASGDGHSFEDDVDGPVHDGAEVPVLYRADDPAGSARIDELTSPAQARARTEQLGIVFTAVGGTLILGSFVSIWSWRRTLRRMRGVDVLDVASLETIERRIAPHLVEQDRREPPAA